MEITSNEEKMRAYEAPVPNLIATQDTSLGSREKIIPRMDPSRRPSRRL